MCLGQRLEGEVRHRVAVHQEEGLAADHRYRPARPASTAEHLGLLPGVADAYVKVAAVADTRGERLREMVEVQHELGDVLAGEPRDDSRDNRLSADGHGGFRP